MLLPPKLARSLRSLVTGWLCLAPIMAPLPLPYALGALLKLSGALFAGPLTLLHSCIVAWLSYKGGDNQGAGIHLNCFRVALAMLLIPPLLMLPSMVRLSSDLHHHIPLCGAPRINPWPASLRTYLFGLPDPCLDPEFLLSLPHRP